MRCRLQGVPIHFPLSIKKTPLPQGALLVVPYSGFASIDPWLRYVAWSWSSTGFCRFPAFHRTNEWHPRILGVEWTLELFSVSSFVWERWWESPFTTTSRHHPFTRTDRNTHTPHTRKRVLCFWAITRPGGWRRQTHQVGGRCLHTSVDSIRRIGCGSVATGHVCPIPSLRPHTLLCGSCLVEHPTKKRKGWRLHTLVAAKLSFSTDRYCGSLQHKRVVPVVVRLSTWFKIDWELGKSWLTDPEFLGPCSSHRSCTVLPVYPWIAGSKRRPR